MAMPINVKEVINAAADTEAARSMPVSVCVFFDPTVPDDLFKCIHDAFQTQAAHASVRMEMYPTSAYAMAPGTDLAVLVAGESDQTGDLALSIRNSGIPVMTVTVSPEAVKAAAIAAGRPLLDADVLAPSLDVDGGSLPENSEFYREPYPLTIDRAKSLLSRMGDWIVDTFREKRLSFALSFPFVRRPLALDSVNATAAQNAGIGMVAIIPGADMPIMTLNQAKMLLQIAAAYDKALGKERLKELAAIVGGGFAFRAIARQLVALAPGWGWIIKGGIGFTGTASMGYAAIAYFEQLVGEGSTVEDAVAAARAEAARVQAAMSSEETPTDAALAAVRTVAGDVAEGAVSAAKNIVPAVRVAAVEARDNIDINPKDLGKHLLGAISSLNKGQ